MNVKIAFHSTAGSAFGILNIKTPPEEPLVDPHTVLFGVDVSASMSDLCADGRSKIHHATHTTKNLYRMFAARSGVRTGLYGFDDRIKSVLLPADLTEATLDTCLQQIDRALYPCGGTNLERALKHAGACITDLKKTDPHRPVTHIFMTDGNATEGCLQVNALVQLVHGDATNIFIGYGLDHSADCLEALGGRPNASYYFIDQIEKGGLVFGEIFHSIFYQRYAKITLGGHGVEFYDFRTNTWGATLFIDAWTSDTDKTYHLRRIYPAEKAEGVEGVKEAEEAEAGIWITGYDPVKKTYGTLAYLSFHESATTDLQRYVFRQRTQEYMFHAKSPGSTDVSDLKTDLRTFLSELKVYMSAHALETDVFYLALCDDLAITLRTYGTVYGPMFATGRSNANGYERAYNISAIPPQRRCRSGRVRRLNFLPPRDNIGDAEDLHTVSTDAVFTPRLTPSMSRAMRSTSGTSPSSPFAPFEEVE